MNRSFLLTAPVLLSAAACAFGQTAATTPTFEVATIKEAPPLTHELMMSGKMHMGRKIDKAYADFGGESLTSLIAYAYGVKSYQVVGQDWMEKTRFDVLGKLPPGASADAVPDMTQALLAERFHLKMHTESKELPVYALVIGKGGSKLSPAPDDYQPTPGHGDVSTLMPSSLDRYASTLSKAVDRPVVDETGLKGDYMLPVGAALIAGAMRGMQAHMQQEAGSAAQAAPSDASAMAVPEFDLSKALIGGLKLEPRKLPMKMIVVEHVDETPTAN
jgi:uncharacterized protein (TIGR03435 family)